MMIMLSKNQSGKQTSGKRVRSFKAENMKTEVQLKVGNHQCTNILASSNLPIVFIVVCFLIIANTRCESAGIMNENNIKGTRMTNSGTLTKPNATTTNNQDPLSILREIYLDSNSKIITMFLPPGGDSVQKFHPNGRYGRRSVNNMDDKLSNHAELAELRFNAVAEPLRSNLHSFSSNLNDPDGRDNKLATRTYEYSKQGGSQFFGDNNESMFADSGVTNYQLELNKLLKCNYTGVSNLYWCDNEN